MVLLGPAAALGSPAHEGGTGLFEVQSALVAVNGETSVAVTGTGYRVKSSREPGTAGDRDVLDAGLQISFGWNGWLETFARFDAPVFSFSEDRPTVVSIADGLVGAKIGLPGHRKWLHTGLAASVSVPWGKRARGLSTDSWDPAVALLLTVPLPDASDRTAASLHFNIGYRWRGDDRGRGYDGNPLYYLEPVYPDGGSDRLDLRGAAQFSARRVTVFAELILDKLLHDDVPLGEGPIFFTPGLRLSISESVSLLLASKIALAIDDAGTTALRPPQDLFPDWQIGFALTWTRIGAAADRDDDGVPDYRDRCPYAAEDVDGVGDGDGCPEVDFDGDGIPDDRDACPEEPEDYDGNADLDGCPEPEVEDVPGADEDVEAEPEPAPGASEPADE